MYVQKGAAAKFKELVVARMSSLRLGDPLQDGTQMGPQADEKQAAAVGKYLDIGTEYGRAIVGGKRATEAGVNFIQPTVFTGLSDQSRLNTEEIFGPVMVMHEFDTEEEAVHRANDTECELQMSYQVYSSLLSAC